MENIALPSIFDPPMPAPPPPPPPTPTPTPLADPSTATKRKRKRVGKSLNGEKEARKANYMRKILNDDKATKNASFQKRKPTLKKKAHELQTYCDVSVCMVCYDSKGNVDMWPQNRKEVENIVNGYKYRIKEDEKRKSDIIGLLEGQKKKFEKKIQENIAQSVKEVVEPLSKLIDGLPRDALRDTLTRLDAVTECLKERKETEKSDSAKKEIKDVAGYGYNGQNIEEQVGLALPKVEEYNGNCFVEPESDAREPLMMIDNMASLEMADFGSILGQSYRGTNVVVASRADPIKLESFDFDMPIEGCTTNNSMVEIGNNALLDPSYCSSFGFGQVGTNFGFVPQSQLTTGYLTRCPDGANNPIFQGLETNVSADSRKLEFSDFHLGNYNAANYTVGVNNKSGLFNENCNSFGYYHQVHGSQDQHPQASSEMTHQASPLAGWRPSTTFHPFGSRSNCYF